MPPKSTMPPTKAKTPRKNPPRRKAPTAEKLKELAKKAREDEGTSSEDSNFETSSGSMSDSDSDSVMDTPAAGMEMRQEEFTAKLAKLMLDYGWNLSYEPLTEEQKKKLQSAVDHWLKSLRPTAQ